MFRLNQYFNLGFIFILITALFFNVRPVSALDTTQGKTWVVLIGGEAEIEQLDEGPAGAWQFMRYYPENLTVNVGDTVLFKLHSAEPHTVTFPKPGEKAPDLVIQEQDGSRMVFNPLAVLPQGGNTHDGKSLIGSGQLDTAKDFPKEFKLEFTTPGTYEYACSFHTKMKGKIIVQPKGTAYPLTQEQVDTAVKQLLDKDVVDSQSKKPAETIQTSPGQNGSTIYNISIGYGNGNLSYMRFIPKNLTIKEGDSVHWIQQDVDTPHTITLTSGAKEPELVLPEPQPNGPPKLVLNPDILMPKGGNNYNGTGYINSGFLWGKDTPIPGPRNFSLKFDKTGTYKYICALHDGMGMTGEITVAPKSFSLNSFGKKKLLLIGAGAALVIGFLFFKFKKRPVV